MKRRHCGVCKLGFSKGRRVELLEGGALRGVVVCQSCAARGVTILTADVETRVRAAAAPFAKHLRKLAQGYDLHDEKVGHGLRLAADILESGRLPPDEAPKSKSNGEMKSPTLTGIASRLAVALQHAPPPLRTFRIEPVRAKRRPSGLSRVERKILTCLAQRGGEPASDAQLLILTGYRNTGSWTGALGALRAASFIRGPGSANEVTPEGRAELGPVETLPRGLALLTHWKTKLGPCCAAILSELFATRRQGGVLSEEILLSLTGYKKTGSWTGALGKLRKLGLLERRRLRISETFYAAIEGDERREVSS